MHGGGDMLMKLHVRANNYAQVSMGFLNAYVGLVNEVLGWRCLLRVSLEADYHTLLPIKFQSP